MACLPLYIIPVDWRKTGKAGLCLQGYITGGFEGGLDKDGYLGARWTAQPGVWVIQVLHSVTLCSKELHKFGSTEQS